MLVGSIASLGTHYAITLSASNCEDGSSLAVEQAESRNREEVLSRLHDAARRLRNKLGESLASVQKHDIPLEQATTSSLEALLAFSRAQRAFRTHGETAAIPLFERALKLDPYFALALSDLGTLYCNLDEESPCSHYAGEAYAFRDRVSERERFVIESNYFMYVSGELERAAQVFEVWKRLYPRMLYPYLIAALVAGNLGRIDVALANDLGAYGIKHVTAVLYRNLSEDYMTLNRFQEASAILDEARAKKLDESLLQNRYQLAFLKNDEKEMENIIAASVGQPDDESDLLASQADTAAFYGRLGRARELSKRAVQSALSAGSKDSAANWEATAALREAEFGNREIARLHAKAAIALSSSKAVEIAVGLTLARSGDTERAREIADRLQRESPKDTLVENYWIPTIRAAIALDRADGREALKQLDITVPYEWGGERPPFTAGATLYPAYLRGLAYLKTNDSGKALQEFQKILDNRGLVWNFPIGALAQLRRAQAYVARTDMPHAREAYRNFFLIWSQADESVSILSRARKEYAARPHSLSRAPPRALARRFPPCKCACPTSPRRTGSRP